MQHIFEIIKLSNEHENGQTRISIGINVKIGEHETVCPLSGVCDSYDALESEIRSLKEDLENLLNRTKTIFNGSLSCTNLDLKTDMKPEEIWEILSSITNGKIFIDSFNNLDEVKRKEVAEHVLTRCNIFSGKGSVFSSRYNNESGLLE